MRASRLFPSGGLAFLPNESPAPKFYIMNNFLEVGKSQLWQHERGMWYSLGSFPYLFTLFPFDILTMAIFRNPKKYLKSSFCFVFSKIMRIYLYAGIRCSLGIITWSLRDLFNTAKGIFENGYCLAPSLLLVLTSFSVLNTLSKFQSVDGRIDWHMIQQ